MSERIRAAQETVDLWDQAPHMFSQDSSHSMVYRPDTPLQALMEALPHDNPADDWESQHPIRESVANLVDGLCEEEQFVILAIFFERLSLRKIGLLLNRDKNWVARVRDSALQNMREA
jgi:DNA-directed RNA polymerase specialized sigma subunit